MKLPTLREVGTEARLLLIGIPVLIWTMVPISRQVTSPMTGSFIATAVSS